mmetsp:Transcript_48299/g.156588  ORF Transcript_48299/g.156588 Transcript_48299/m.156588 type:complete len:221 (-) Transcript_48299:94-756(-)
MPLTPTPVRRRSFIIADKFERGSLGDSGRLSEASVDTDSEPRSPMPAKRLFSSSRGRAQSVTIVLLLLFCIWTWEPLLRKFWLTLLSAWSIARPGTLDRPHVHIFHETRCAGESITVGVDADLCDLRYASGQPAKDNVASVLIAGAAGFSLSVFGTCWHAERPHDPMLLETLSAQGCSDLKYPICGGLQLTPPKTGGSVESEPESHLRGRGGSPEARRGN